MTINKLITALLICVSLTFASGCMETGIKNPGGDEAAVSCDDRLLQWFISSHPENEVLKCAQADVNGDNKEDLVLIYRAGKEKNMMLVVLDLSGELVFTNEVPAPVSNQQITFKDIDEKPPLEFIVQGMKGANVGYAIYRVEGTRLEDLFGEGMKDCC